jgi:hypothetical protein
VPGEFVALADLLRAPSASGGAVVASPDSFTPACHDSACDDGLTHRPPESLANVDVDLRGDDDDGVVAVLREARLFRARLADAFDDAAARLLRELATGVLARELRLAPCDLAAIVRRIAERAPALRVRVAAGDAPALADALPGASDAAVVEDPALARGDAIVELAGGALDARLGVRLAIVLEAFA